MKELSKASEKINVEIRAGLSVLIVIFTFVMFYFCMFRDTNPDVKDYIMFILGSLTTILSQVISYYFGASKSSDDKKHKIENTEN
jgi:hypothetical protein